MTAYCGGGASQAKSGVEPVLSLGSSGIAAILRRTPFAKFAPVVQAVASGVSFASGPFCAGDPPADPNLTQQDLTDAIDFGNPVAQVPAAARVVQWLLRQYWLDVCECVSVPTPPLAPVSDPGPLGTSTGAPGGSLATCLHFTGPVSVTAPAGATTYASWTTNVFPLLGPTVTFNAGSDSHAYTCLPIPNGMTTTSWSTTYSSADPINNFVALNISWFNATGGLLLQAALGNSQDHNPHVGTNVTVPLGSAFWSLDAVDTLGPAGTFNWSLDFSAQCGGTNVVQDCCPPDPSVDLRLRQIIELVNQLLAQQSGTVGYKLGPAHPGISGSASFAIPSRVGMKVEITQGTPTNPILEGNPPYQWNLGWMSVLNGDGMIEERRITRQQQVWLSPAFPVGGTFGYFLHPGIVATFTELEPLP